MYNVYFGFQYCVTFIDDFSQCTWLYLIKSQSKLFSIFEIFCAKIKTQFNVKVQVLCSDNALEYFSNSFTQFMSSQGILHHSSFAYTPQQNGVAKHKNKHLIETTQTLLLQHNVPLCFWDDAVLTTCYLVNKMPSHVLYHKVSNQPLYALPLRVFSCTCLVNNHSPR